MPFAPIGDEESIPYFSTNCLLDKFSWLIIDTIDYLYKGLESPALPLKLGDKNFYQLNMHSQHAARDNKNTWNGLIYFYTRSLATQYNFPLDKWFTHCQLASLDMTVEALLIIKSRELL